MNTRISARRKAFSAVSFGQPTSALVKNAPGDGGAPSGDLDEKDGNAGLKTLER